MFSALSKILLFALTAAASKTNSETKRQKELISGNNHKLHGRKNMQMKLENMANDGRDGRDRPHLRRTGTSHSFARKQENSPSA